MKKITILLLLLVSSFNSTSADQNLEKMISEIESLEASLESKKKALINYQNNLQTVISIDKDGNYYINSMDDSIPEPISLNELINIAFTRIDARPDMKVFIAADKRVGYGLVIEVISLLKSNTNISTVELMTDPNSNSPTPIIDDQDTLTKNEQELLKQKAKIVMAELKRKAEEEKAEEAKKRRKKAEEEAERARIILNELEEERAKQQLAFENEQYNRLLTQEVQAEQDQKRSMVIEDQRSTLAAAWVANIAARVKSVWRYQGAEDGWTAEVYIIQDRDGNVLEVDVRNTNVGNSSKAKAFNDSILRAVYKASPLPAAPDDTVFNKELILIFGSN